MPRGRKTKWTPEVQERIVSAIRGGSYLETAARFGGINVGTFYRWMDAGAQAPHGHMSDFRDAVLRAETEAEVAMIASWQRQGMGTPERPGDWRALRDLLARRHPERWMPREAREVSGPGGGPVEVSTNARDALLARLDVMQGRLAPITVPSLLAAVEDGDVEE